ncbi:MAG: DNA-3-methyladenine glycosylase I [Candidatus Moraniibacteriota bacterium]
MRKTFAPKRCQWAKGGDALSLSYHDREWGVPVRNDRKIFEFLVLESFQAGLSWRIVLNKRKGLRKAFENFDPEKVARFTPARMQKLMQDEDIIRNRLKIEATVNNAKRFLEVRKEFGTFSKYMWHWVGGKPIRHHIRKMSDVPISTDEALRWSLDLKKRGFKFMGPTTVYAHMQAVGMVNDHEINCFVSR